jgi:hypothetical protein
MSDMAGNAAKGSGEEVGNDRIQWSEQGMSDMAGNAAKGSGEGVGNDRIQWSKWDERHRRSESDWH